MGKQLVQTIFFAEIPGIETAACWEVTGRSPSQYDGEYQYTLRCNELTVTRSELEELMRRASAIGPVCEGRGVAAHRRALGDEYTRRVADVG